MLFLTLQSLETSTVFCFSVFFKANLVVLVDACRLPFLLFFLSCKKVFSFCFYGLSSRGVQKPDFLDFSNTFPANSPSIHVLSQLTLGWAHPTSLIVKNVARQCVCGIDTKRSTIAGDGAWVERCDECMIFDSRCSKDLF